MTAKELAALVRRYTEEVGQAELVGGPLDGETHDFPREMGHRMTFRSMRFGPQTYQRDSATTATYAGRS